MTSVPSRTLIVWISFVVAMTVVGGGLIITDPSPAPRIENGRRLAQPALELSSSGSTHLETREPIAPERWLEIVIHDSGSPFGSVETTARQHQLQGLQGLGYHFLIGNGNGMGDGELHVGYRWNRQLAGAHVIGSSDKARAHNEQGIGICLIGDGETGEFSPAQMDRLVRLVASLQSQLGIPATHVRLHRDIADTRSPGTNFPTVWFREQLSPAG